MAVPFGFVSTSAATRAMPRADAALPINVKAQIGSGGRGVDQRLARRPAFRRDKADDSPGLRRVTRRANAVDVPTFIVPSTLNAMPPYVDAKRRERDDVGMIDDAGRERFEGQSTIIRVRRRNACYDDRIVDPARSRVRRGARFPRSAGLARTRKLVRSAERSPRPKRRDEAARAP